MFEVRMHGRGGTGTLMAARILGTAAFLSGFHVQDFALYGAERRGAPVVSFVRFDKDPILERGYIITPEAVVIFDDTLDLRRCFKWIGEGVAFINTIKPKKEFKKYAKTIFTLDATSIALKHLGKPIPNTAMLGALVKVIRPIRRIKLMCAIEIELDKYSKQIIEANKKAAMMGYGAV